MELVTREAAGPEAGLLADLIAAAFADVAERFFLTPERCPSHPAFITAGCVRHSLSRGTVYLLALHGGQPCGCVGIRGVADGVCALERLAVPPAWRRRGIGGRLLERALAVARAQGGRWVEVGLIADHADLRAWYEVRGFRWCADESHPHLPFAVARLRLDLSVPRAS